MEFDWFTSMVNCFSLRCWKELLKFYTLASIHNEMWVETVILSILLLLYLNHAIHQL